MLKKARDLLYHMEIMTVNEICPPEPMNAEDPLFILIYPQVQRVSQRCCIPQGYLTYVNSTFREVFDLKQDDVFWCTRRCRLDYGHSLWDMDFVEWNHNSDVEGIPSIRWARTGHIVDKHNVTILYTAPTAIRAMMRRDAFVRERIVAVCV